LRPAYPLLPMLRVSDVLLFSSSCSAAHLDLHSFPTRRSSDLDRDVPAGGLRGEPRPLAAHRPPQAARGGPRPRHPAAPPAAGRGDRKSTRLNSSHGSISYAVFCLKKKKQLALLAESRRHKE